MKGGTWHVILEGREYIAVWVSDAGEVPCDYDSYLAGDFPHRFQAEALAADANFLIRLSEDGEHARALLRIVEMVR